MIKSRIAWEGLQQRTLRDFSGGLNTQDSEWNIKTNYATTLRNLVVGDDGSLKTRASFRNFTNANSTIGSNQSPTTTADWGVYNEPLTLGASAELSTVLGEAWVYVDCDAPHGLVDHNWVRGISTITVGNLGGVPYTEFNNSQWRCVDVISATTFRVRVDTDATSAASSSTVAPTRYCNKIALMLPQEASTNEHTLGFVDGWYYNNFLIVVDKLGVVYKINGVGEISIIYNDIIAAAESGAPRGWRPLSTNGPLVDLVTAVTFKGSLQLHNGLDKPLEVYLDSTTVKCRYLVDVGTGLNTYTPIAQFATVANQYVCLAGQPLDPFKVSISAARTGGTYVGDPDPNDATEIFIDEYSETNDTVLTGITTYRGRLIVMLANSALVFRLGTYDSDGNHIPAYEETIYDFGTRSPRSMTRLSDDLYVVDESGLVSMRQARIANNLEVSRVSDVIRTSIGTLLARETTQTLLNDVFARIDRRNRLLITRITRANTILSANVDASVRFLPGTQLAGIRVDAPITLYIGDTVTLYDFGGQDGIELSNGANQYRQYRIVGKSADDKEFFISTGVSNPTSVGYESQVGFDEKIYFGSDNTSFVQERKDAYYTFKNLTSTRLAAWQEMSGYERFGPVRAIAVSELNNLFVIYDYFIMALNYDELENALDGEGFLGQNIHTNALLTSGDRTYHAGRVVFDPATSDEPVLLPQHYVIDSPGTLAQDSAGKDWPVHVGVPIEFEYVSPWADLGNRRSEKSLRYVALDTAGLGIFTLELFADGVYETENGILAPVVKKTFYAGGRKYHHNKYLLGNELYNIDALSVLEGTTVVVGAPVNSPRIDGYADAQLVHELPMNFRTMRFRISGDTAYGSVQIVGISFMFLEGRMVGA